jgi:outer membrane protein assembly factor BamB
MNSWQKSASIWLITLLAVSIFATIFSGVTAETINPKYAGTKSIDSSLDIKFSKNNNSILYLDSDNSVNFSVGFGRYTFDYISLGTFIYSVSYKASWQNSPVQVYDWSFNDPANLKDDDPNPKQSSQGTISLKDAPLGKHQITVTTLAGDYVTDFNTYWIYTVNTTSTLNFTIANQPPVTPSPTFSDESGILWRTDIPWNLTGTPAQDRWNSDISDKSRAWTNPVIDEGVMYAGATSTVYLNLYGRPALKWVDIYAFDANNGQQIWDYQTVYSGITNLAVTNGQVYFGAQAGYNTASNQSFSDCVTSLEASKGNLLWQTPCTIFYATPVTENGRVFINSGHSLLAFDGANGKILWNYTTADIVVFSPTVANGILYAASYDNTLYALNSLDGSKVWSYKTENGFSSAIVVNGVVYASSGDNNIYALNAVSGAKLWSRDTTPPEFAWVNYTSHSTPFYYNEAIYFTSSSEQHIHNSEANGPNNCKMWDKTSVFALDADSGRKLWNYTVNTGELGYPVTVKNGIVYTQYGGSIVGFNAQNGALIWNYTNAGIYPVSQPVVTDGVLYIGFSDGQVYALRTPTVDIQANNQSTTFLIENQNTTLLIAIVAVLVSALITLTIVYRNKRSKGNE